MTEALLKSTVDTLWYTRCPVPTPLGIAAQLGWFAEEFRPEGIAIRTLQESVTAKERDSHFDHNLRNSFRQGGNIPAIWARSLGRETRVIGLTWTDEYQGIITLPDSGIKTVRDLRGRKLGLPVNDILIDFNRATALKAYITALGLEGLKHSDVEFVDTVNAPLNDDRPKDDRTLAGVDETGNRPRRTHSYAAEVFALVRGTVDAIFVKGVLGLETTRLLGATVVTDIGFHPDPQVRINNGSPRTLTVDSELLDNRPDLVARFLNRVINAGQWAAAHEAETIAYIGRETGGSDDWVRAAYGDRVHHNLKTELEDTHIHALNDFKNFLFQWGFLKFDFDVYDWIDREPLQAVRGFWR